MKRLLVAMIVATQFPSACQDSRAGGTPAQCAATKRQETGKKADRKLTCWSKEVIRPGTYAACAAKAEVKFAAKFAQAEAGANVPRPVTRRRSKQGRRLRRRRGRRAGGCASGLGSRYQRCAAVRLYPDAAWKAGLTG